MQGYYDIAGDGGSGIVEQVTEQRARITGALAAVRHLVAVGSGKGGVGKSTLTLHLAGALQASGARVGILDADFNGPSQARMAGLQGAVFVPPPSPEGFGAAAKPSPEGFGAAAQPSPEGFGGAAQPSPEGFGAASQPSPEGFGAAAQPSPEGFGGASQPSPEGFGAASTDKVSLPRTRDGIAVFSMGSLIPESEALEFDSVVKGESQTWRATREFALLGQILASFDWRGLDILMFDLPPGAERTVQYADFLGRRTSFVLVTIPTEVARGVVARSVAALSKGPNRLLGYIENMSGYYCRDCNAIKPLFVSREPGQADRNTAPGLGLPCLGTVPFDPELARNCDLGIPFAALREMPVGRAFESIAQRLLDALEAEPR
jgi:ATP-binding protein involved in chromosome partitioning